MFCHKCGTQLEIEAQFCHKCGTKAICEDDNPPISSGAEETAIKEAAPSIGEEHSEHINQIPTDDTAPKKEPYTESKSSKFIKWWKSCSKPKKVLVVMGAILISGLVLYALVAFLREFGYLLFGAAVIGGFIITLATGSEKEKIETRKAIVQMVVVFVAIILIACVVVMKPDFISNIFRPGANVRNAYLTQYSESVTIGDAFEDFFENGKWSTHKTDDYSYVLFDGSCEYLGQKSDVRVRFKITGENFVVDSMDINGQPQGDLVLYALISAVYDDVGVQ